MSGKNNRYPHLLPADIVLWERFLAKYPARFRRYDYDVRVGQGIQARPDWPPNIARMAAALTCKRIDAIGYAPGETCIIEITLRAGLKAVGQLQCYPELYRQSYKVQGKLTRLLIAEEIHPDIEQLLPTLGIPYLTLPPTEA